MMIIHLYYARDEISLRDFLISFFKALEYYFEVRDINIDFLKDNYLFLCYFDDEKF